jgi:hypothetical protein
MYASDCASKLPFSLGCIHPHDAHRGNGKKAMLVCGACEVDSQRRQRDVLRRRVVALAAVAGIMSILVAASVSMAKPKPKPGSANAKPLITGFSPAAGSVGEQVLVTGGHLRAVKSLRFGSVTAIFSVGSDSLLVASVPVGATTSTITVTTAKGGTASAPSSFSVTDSHRDLTFDVLLFGLGALLANMIVMLLRLRGTSGNDRAFTPTYARVSGLIVIATLAVALALSTVEIAAKTGAFTLLGTVAGYLAAGVGTKTKTDNQQEETVAI